MCRRVVMPDGGYVIVCGGHRTPQLCEQCRTRPGRFLCDGPRTPGVQARAVDGGDKTCSKSLCDRCVHRHGSHDYCDEHAAPETRRLAL